MERKNIVTGLAILILAALTVWSLFSLQLQQQRISNLIDETSELEALILQQQQNLTAIQSRLNELEVDMEKTMEWKYLDTFQLGGAHMLYEQSGDYPNYRILRIKWNTTELEYTDTPAFLVSSSDGTLLKYLILPDSTRKGVFYFETIDGSFKITTINVQSTITCTLEEYR